MPRTVSKYSPDTNTTKPKGVRVPETPGPESTREKPAVKKAPVNTSSKARTGLPPMKCGGKTKKR